MKIFNKNYNKNKFVYCMSKAKFTKKAKNRFFLNELANLSNIEILEL